MTNHQFLVEKAISKFKKAKRIAVENFSSGYQSLNMEAQMNLEQDTRDYSWNAQTVAAIRYVINNYVPETLPDACKIGNRGFILSNVKPAQEELPVTPVKLVVNDVV
jgi:hypothetical protein